MEDIRIDSHKLIYHPQQVYKWLKGDDIYPIYIEISPSGVCNHRCIFCAFEYLGYKPKFIDKDVLKRAISDMAGLGVKSIMYSGEGEPFLHPDLTELILYSKKVGIDVAVAMNGSLFSPYVAKECLSALTWIKISINAGTRSSYAKIHGCSEKEFDKVIYNLKEAVRIRKENGYNCTIGGQIVLLPENKEEVTILIGLLKDIGLDYLAVKPFIKHPLSSHNISRDLNEEELSKLYEKVKGFGTEGFKIYFRTHSFVKLKEPKPYEKCLGLAFFCEITSNGNIYTCGPYLGKESFCYGNIYKNSFLEIWKSKERKAVLDRIARLDVQDCMKNCRLDEMNKYLWELKHPSPHVNFI
jgi:radical SAM protein with 4Fe4S-binding SPASM domain